jgi:hypothetical protein
VAQRGQQAVMEHWSVPPPALASRALEWPERVVSGPVHTAESLGRADLDLSNPSEGDFAQLHCSLSCTVHWFVHRVSLSFVLL